MADKVVLSFHDSLLRESDLELLTEGRWLNDKLIGFVFEYFTHEQFSSVSSDVVFISPDVAHFLKLCQGPDVAIFLEPLLLPRKNLIFFVVNDNESRGSAGGSHWSVLVFNREANDFQHYDSNGSSNRGTARNLAENIMPYLEAGESPSVVEAVSPQQENCYDCGIYAICITEHLCKTFLGDNTPLKQAVTSQAVAKRRRGLKDLIEQLGQKPERADA